MSDVFTKAKRSLVMSKIRSSGNLATEMAAIHLFRIHGIKGWRRGRVVQTKTSRGCLRIRPDFVFPKSKTIVFVDGEFWHGHPTLCVIPKTRTSWWREKIEANRRRDKKQNKALRNDGWTVVRIWQSDLRSCVAVRKIARVGLLQTAEKKLLS